MTAAGPARYTSCVLDSSRVLPSLRNRAHTRRSILHKTPSPEGSSVRVSCLSSLCESCLYP